MQCSVIGLNNASKYMICGHISCSSCMHALMVVFVTTYISGNAFELIFSKYLLVTISECN